MLSTGVRTHVQYGRGSTHSSAATSRAHVPATRPALYRVRRGPCGSPFKRSLCAMPPATSARASKSGVMGKITAPITFLGALLGIGRRNGTDSKPEGPKEIDRDVLAECYKYGLLAKIAYADSVEEARAFLKEIDLPTTKDDSTMNGLISAGNIRLLKYPSTDTEVVVVKMRNENGIGHELVLAFRGTETTWNKGVVKDVISDVSLVKINVTALEGLAGRRDLRDCEVHKGFLTALNNALRGCTTKPPTNGTTKPPTNGTKAPNPNPESEPLPVVIKKLFPEGQQPTRIVCTGHSLGGALCTLAAFWCKTVAFPDTEVKCIAFASPRVGNPGFAAKFNELIKANEGGCFRFTHKDDVVPSIPPYFWGFDHVSNPVFLLEPHKKNYNVFQWTENVDKSVKKYVALLAMRPVAAYTSTADHSMNNYLAAMGNVLGLEALSAAAKAISSAIDVREKEVLSGVPSMAVKVTTIGDDPPPEEAVAPAPTPAPAQAVYEPATAEALIAEVPAGMGTAAPVVAAEAN